MEPEKKKLSVEYFVDHYSNNEIEIDFSDKISLLKADEQSCPCGDDCDKDCDCGCHGEKEELPDNQSEAIDYSVRIVKALESKVKHFNKSHPSKRITTRKLKEIYCSMVEICEKNKNLYAFARINKFLEVVSDFNSLTAKNLKLALGELDPLGNWSPSEQDLTLAKKDIEKHGLDFSFGSVEELFLETPKTCADYEIEY